MVHLHAELFRRFITAVLSFAFTSVAVAQQQRADPDFKPVADKPACTKHHPQILFDEAHHNFHTASGRYKPFADLIASDGRKFGMNVDGIDNKQFALNVIHWLTGLLEPDRATAEPNESASDQPGEVP